MMKNGPDDVGLGARLLAIETTLRALVEQASLADPGLRDRIRRAAEAYLATVPELSELEVEFTKRSKEFVESIIRTP